MKTDTIATGLYALLLIVGGMIGYFTAHSLMSLIMGTSFALMLGFSAWGIQKGCIYSIYSAIGLTALLLAFFMYRYVVTLKFFPGGIMAILSLSLLAILIKGWKNRPAKV